MIGHGRARRAAAGAGVALLLAGCANEAEPGAEAPPSPTATATAAPSATAPPLPAGWRWESYRDVQVGVPGDWGYDVGTQRISQWCTFDGDREAGAVGRPGPATAVGCLPPSGGPAGLRDPGALVDSGGTFVAFEAAALGPQTEGDRTVVPVGGVLVVVQARQPLRDRIAATVHRFTGVDARGCPADDPVAWSLDARPSSPVALADIRDVTSVAACRYRILEQTAQGLAPAPQPPNLISSAAVAGPAAQQALAAMAAASAGGGPNDPGSCSAEVAYGDEAIVLRVSWGANRVSRVYVRYSGCDHNGVDDGVTVRALTSAARPFLDGANRPDHWNGHTLDFMGTPAAASATPTAAPSAPGASPGPTSDG